MTENEILTSDENTGAGNAPAADSSGITAWLVFGLVTALLAATGGYFLGQSRDQTVAAQSPLAVGRDTFLMDGQGRSAAEPGGPSMGRGMDIMPVGFGRIVFTEDGLSDDASATDAWSFDPSAVFSKATAAMAADILGVGGEPTLNYGSWSIGPQDGSGPALQLIPDGLGSLNYWNPLLDPYGCPQPVPGRGEEDVPPLQGGPATDPDAVAPDSVQEAPDSPQGGGTAPGFGGMPDDRSCNDPSGDALSDNAAIQSLKDTMADLGVDTADYRFTTTDYGMPQAAAVTAAQMVDGQQTGVTWGATFSGEQIQSLYGALAPLVSLGSYDVVSQADAVHRLTDPRFGMGSWGGPMPFTDKPMPAGMSGAMGGAMEDGGELPQGDDLVVSAPKPTLPPTMNPGGRFAWPVTSVTITGAELGLAMYTQPDGSAVLLPTYQLTADDGSAWSVVAVVDSSLNFTEFN